jgi:hypothetical protein
VCKWALCTTTSFYLCYCMGCIRHVDVPGQQSMVTMRGCASFLRALGVSQILVLHHFSHGNGSLAWQWEGRLVCGEQKSSKFIDASMVHCLPKYINSSREPNVVAEMQTEEDGQARPGDRRS